ncbi:MAG: 16S rRNA (guanine(527)-N(7))-methyltransferase RsmG [Nitriliruptoraceae bacterium]
MESLELSAPLVRLASLIRGSPHNLVSRSAREELLSRHIPESVLLARQLPVSERPLRLLDVGSGGGLPGLVIALERPDLQVALLEAKQKKVDFLRGAISELGLDVVVHHGRAEDLSRTDLGGAFDLVTARAVAPLERLVPWTIPYLRPGGLLFAVKGERWQDEVIDARTVLARAGAAVIEAPAPASGPAAGPRIVLIARTRPIETTDMT